MIQPDLSIIIVSWNVRDLLRACLRSIEAQKGALTIEIIVVDNASGDGSVEMVSAEFPHVNLIASQENLGFPAGNNVGIEAATGDFLFLLNPDTEIIGDALQQMVAYLKVNPEMGLVGPQLRNTDGTHQSSRRRFPTFWTGVFESTWLQAMAPRHLLRSFYAQDLSDDGSHAVDWVMGAAMMVRREVVHDVGGMDAGYFMYSEELDWCRRIKMAGWDVGYVGSAEILHHVGKSSEQAVVARHINFNRAKLRYFRKYHGMLPYLTLRFILLAQFAFQIKVEALKWLIGHKRSLRQQRIAAYWRVLRSGLPAAGY